MKGNSKGMNTIKNWLHSQNGLKKKERNESKLRSRLEEMETQINCLTEEKCFKEKQLNDNISQLKNANNEIMELNGIIKQMEREKR